MFDRLAGGYDRGNRVISLGQDLRWKRRAVGVLSPRTGARYLDCGAGTGDLSRLILASTGPGARVVALDASARMMKAGGLPGLQGVEMLVGDALDSGLEPASFDGAISGFLLRNLPDLPRFFREMHRVLRPGGRLVVLEIAYPTGAVRRPLFSAYFHAVAPLLGGLVTGEFAAYRYLSRSLRGFPSPQALARMATVEGFTQTDLVRSRWLGMFVAAYEKPEHPVPVHENEKKARRLRA